MADKHDEDLLLNPETMLQQFLVDWGKEIAFNLAIARGNIPSDKFPVAKAVFDGMGNSMADIVRPTMDETILEIQKRLKDIPLYLYSFALAMGHMQVRNNEALLRVLRDPDP